MTDGTELPAPLVARLSRALRARPFGCFFDFDGTLAAIRLEPLDASIPEERRGRLKTLAARIDTVAVISGRAHADVAPRVGLDEVLVVGGHGNDWGPGAGEPRAALEWWVQAEEVVGKALRLVPAARVERKPASIAIHTRGLAVRPNAAEALLTLATPAVAVRLMRRGVELMPPSSRNKGDALRRIVAERRLRGALVCGDDVTDLDMFAACADLAGVDCISVLARSPETPPFPASTDFEVAGVVGVDALIRTLIALTTPRRGREAGP